MKISSTAFALLLVGLAANDNGVEGRGGCSRCGSGGNGNTCTTVACYESCDVVIGLGGSFLEGEWGNNDPGFTGNSCNCDAGDTGITEADCFPYGVQCKADENGSACDCQCAQRQCPGGTMANGDDICDYAYVCVEDESTTDLLRKLFICHHFMDQEELVNDMDLDGIDTVAYCGQGIGYDVFTPIGAASSYGAECPNTNFVCNSFGGTDGLDTYSPPVGGQGGCPSGYTLKAAFKVCFGQEGEVGSGGGGSSASEYPGQNRMYTCNANDCLCQFPAGSVTVTTYGNPDESSPNPPPNNPPGNGGGIGDPHFLTWGGEWFDYHGICDLVLASSAKFGDGLGLEVQVRTKPKYDYSYIESAALKIGDDVLEVGSWGEHWINGVEDARMPRTVADRYTITHSKVGKYRHYYTIGLDHGEEGAHISVDTYKDLVSVRFVNVTMEDFGDAVGIMGEWDTGIRYGRDGATIMEDDNLFGQEWQVLSSEDMLFQSRREPQHPQQCADPSQMKAREGRRLGEAGAISKHDAREACAHLEGINKANCVHDVMITQDLGVAETEGF